MSETQQRRSGGGDRRGRDDRRGQAPKEESKYLERVVTINRVAKVVEAVVASASPRWSSSATARAWSASATARRRRCRPRSPRVWKNPKHFFRVPLIQRTIRTPSRVKTASVVLLRPASPGTGVIAGGSARAVLECAGVHDVLAKSLGSPNAINVVHATVDALKQLRTPEAVAKRRGMAVEDVAPAAISALPRRRWQVMAELKITQVLQWC